MLLETILTTNFGLPNAHTQGSSFPSRQLRQKSLTEFSQLAGLQSGCWPPISAGRKLSDLARAQLPVMSETGPGTA